MIKVTFKNLEKSELAREAATERVEYLTEKFPDLKGARITVTLEMHNSPLQAGPDMFTVKFQVASGRYRDVTIEKSATNLYVALADTVDHILLQCKMLMGSGIYTRSKSISVRGVRLIHS